MMKKSLLLVSILFQCLATLTAQINENFSDGDFTANPSWGGSVAKFTVNGTQQLQSNDNVGGTNYYLSTSNTLATTAEWYFYVNLKFATSGVNYVDVFLTASDNDLSVNTTTGYFVRIGNTSDEISLYRKDGASSVVIINGADGVVSSSTDNKIRVKVLRDASNQWTLSRDLSGGTSYIPEGVATDATYTTSTAFGFYVVQSTAATPRLNHYFDDIIVQAYVPDVTPPSIVSNTVLTPTAVDILFNEPLDITTAQTATNYSVNNSFGFPSSVTLDGSNPALVHLTFTNSLLSAVNYTLTVNGVTDIAGNAINNGTTSFSFYIPQQYDIVIDEIMADPDPVVGLPALREWIELRNTTAFAINLQGWKIGDGTAVSGGMPNYTLAPNSYVIVCTGSAVPELTPFGNVISVTSFPSLSNDGKQLILTNAQGNTMHAVNYSSTWYQNELKANGGWTLEMIDTNNPCSGISNWKASTDASGGTPGRINSVDAVNADATLPKLVKAFATNNTTLTLVFNEPLDSSSAATAGNYTVNNGIGSAISAVAIAPNFDRVILTFANPLVVNTIYTVTASGVTDCVGNAIGTNNNTRVGLPLAPERFDIVVNEILFNPKPTAVDYVEIYNRSNKIIDLKDVYIANRNTAGEPASKTIITTESLLIFPGDYWVLTTNPSSVKANYITQNPDAFITVSLPSYNDDKGNVILMDINESTIDEISYTDKWHFKLIDDKEGVSLERIDANDTTLIQAAQEKNWHSASTSSGYGTPTFKNSQHKTSEDFQGEIKVTPEIVSPDNDGFDDFATIDYNFPEAGYVANVTVFNSSGRPVRFLQRNALCGIKGNFRWDGLGEKNQTLPVGIYIIYSEIFNLNGKKKQFKNTVVIARRN